MRECHGISLESIKKTARNDWVPVGRNKRLTAIRMDLSLMEEPGEEI